MKSPRASAAPSPSAAAKTGGSVQWGLMLLLVATLSPTSPVRTTSHLHDLATVDTVMPSSYANYRGGASHQPQYDRYAEAAAFFDVEFASADPQPNSKSDKKQSTAEDADGASSSTGTPQFPSRLARQRARKLQRRRRSTSAAQDDDSESDGTAYDEDDLMPIDDCSISVSTCNLSGPESTVDERAATESPIEDSSLIRTSSVSATSPAALVHAMTFLPLDALDVARDGVADELSMAVDFVAPRPIAGAPGAVFVRIAMNANASSRPSLDDKSLQGLSRRAKLAAVRGEASFEWRCLHCGSLSDNRKKCSTCSAEIAHAACRVFMGQLCKDATAEVTAYMLRSLAPEVHIRHIESHTNGRDGRGKGCAWIYLNKVADAKKLTELHKRIFLDVDCDNFQGFWYVKDASLMPNLAAMSDVVGALPERPSALPRHPLVVEWQHNEAKVA